MNAHSIQPWAAEGTGRGQLTLRHDGSLVMSWLGEQGAHSEASIEWLGLEMGRFVASLEACGVSRLGEVTEAHARSFIGEPAVRGGGWRDASSSTLHSRRTVVRTVFRAARQLGLAAHDPTLDLQLPARSAQAVRALVDSEQELCQLASFYTARQSRLPAVWALGQAGATNTELTAATARDVNLVAGRVWLHGNRRLTPRWAPLTGWGARQLERRLNHHHDTDEPLMARSARESTGHVSSSIAIADVLRKAGLRAEPDLQPKSLRMWFATTTLTRTGSIVEVARLLGVRSLDTAARWASWDWPAEGDDER